MLGKLIKNEFIAVGRVFLGMYAFMIVLTPLFSLLMRLGSHSTAGLLTFVLPVSIFGYVVLMIAAFVASFVLIVMRFYRTVSTSEAYLTFTLPVPTWQIIFSKWLVAFILEVITFVLAAASVIVTLVLSGSITLPELVNALRNYLYLTIQDQNQILFLLLVLLSSLAGAAAGITQYYFAISLGQIMNDHRVIASIAFYMATYMILQFISMFAAIPISIMAEDNLDGLLYTSFGLSIIENLIFGAIFFVGTCMVFKKKLNVH